MTIVHGTASTSTLRHFNRSDSQAVYKLAERKDGLGEKVKDAMGIIDQAVVTYGSDGLSLSFNGGKDCTVLLHLLAASITRHFPPSTDKPTPISIKSVYIQCSSPFPSVDSFVEVCTERYRLDLMAVEGTMKQALGEYIASSGHSTKGKEVERSEDEGSVVGGGIKAILVGTRRGDPHGALLTPFTPTDPTWPQFMRVHPILDWSYSEIWDFLREPTLTLGEGQLEWCNLYDVGYTSLGSTHDTFPNPLLRSVDEAGKSVYRPAWELEDASTERAGRSGGS